MTAGSAASARAVGGTIVRGVAARRPARGRRPRADRERRRARGAGRRARGARRDRGRGRRARLLAGDGGVLGQWLAPRCALTPNAVLCGGAIVAALGERRRPRVAAHAVRPAELGRSRSSTCARPRPRRASSASAISWRRSTRRASARWCCSAACSCSPRSRSARSAARRCSRRRWAITGVLVEFLKTSPPQPLPTLGVVAPHVTSWPSGHAALQGSLALGLVLWWWAAGLPRPSILAALVVPLAVLVGYSRAFLGIHGLSEVFAGWLVATSRRRSSSRSTGWWCRASTCCRRRGGGPSSSPGSSRSS